MTPAILEMKAPSSASRTPSQNASGNSTPCKHSCAAPAGKSSPPITACLHPTWTPTRYSPASPPSTYAATHTLKPLPTHPCARKTDRDAHAKSTAPTPVGPRSASPSAIANLFRPTTSLGPAKRLNPQNDRKLLNQCSSKSKYIRARCQGGRRYGALHVGDNRSNDKHENAQSCLI